MEKKRYAEPIDAADYEEPRCPLCMESPEDEERVHSIDMRRVMEKLDDYLARKDYAAAERHLEFWLGEARLGNDKRGEFAVRGEQIGFYRKRGEADKCFACVDKALDLMRVLEYEDSVSGATCWVNCGTAAQAFGKPELALEYFERAKIIYDKNLPETDARLGGLYNNMALSCVARKRYGEAHACYTRALEIMEQVKGGEPERAITLLNMANAVEAEHGLEKAERKIEQLLDEAETLLAAGDPLTHPELAEVIHPGYYAFVCESCAPTFGYYGYFLAAKRFADRAREITEQLT
ncbi:MAG: tetratricopeptide repeat protein [Firmicutes bacterium]|nr:tetratricopeptide repeat protein [Bacillota bacterium]